MIITGLITVVTAVLYWFLFPDSPTSAWFLTPEERAKAVLRIRENQTGVENKTFKKEQMIEALTDSKTWWFALFTALANVPNSLLNQRTIIVTSFGWTPLQSTLFGCVDGVIEIITIFVGVQVRAPTLFITSTPLTDSSACGPHPQLPRLPHHSLCCPRNPGMSPRHPVAMGKQGWTSVCDVDP